MKLFQAVKTCGEIASLDFSEKYFAEETTDIPNDRSIKIFVMAARFVVDKLFYDSGANICTKTVSVANNKLSLPSGCKVLSVEDKQGNSVRFEYVNGGLCLKNGEVVVTYGMPHAEIGWREDLPVPNNGTNDRALIYGIMSEYFLLQGDGEQAATWRARFEDCVGQTSVKGNVGNLPVGRWLY